MDFTTPNTIIMDSQMIAAAIGFFIFTTAGVVWGYSKLLSNINKRFDVSDGKWALLNEKFGSMEKRNEKADTKTEHLETIQKAQETTIAVMATNMGHLVEGMVRVEKSVGELASYIRNEKNKS